MSTKTTFKRIALVAVAALGFGVLSVVPSNATLSNVAISTPTGGTAGFVTGTSGAVNSDTTTAASFTVTALATSAQDTITVRIYENTKPSSTALAADKVKISPRETTTANTFVVAAGTTANGGLVPATFNKFNSTNFGLAGRGAGGINRYDSATVGSGYDIVSGGVDSALTRGTSYGNVGATFNVNLESGTAYTAGTYTYTVLVTAHSFTGSSWTTTTSQQIVSIVVSGVAEVVNTPAAASAKAIIEAGNPATVTSITDSATSGSFTVATTPIGKILVSNFNTAGSTAPDTITAVMTGPGYIYDGTNNGRRLVVYGTSATFSIFADGTSGEGVITITTAAGASFVKKATFFDTKPATATAVVAKAFIKAGTTAVGDVFAITVKDTLGNAIKDAGAVVTAAPTDTATTVGGAATCAWNVAGDAYHCSVAGKAADKFGPVAYTFTATGTGINAAAKVTTSATVTFSDNVATKAVLAGPATGTPGATAEYTLTLTDKNGYAVADQTYGKDGLGGALFSATAADTVASAWGTLTPFSASESYTSKSGVITGKGVLPIAGVASLSLTLIGDGIATSGAIDKTIGKTKVTVSTEVSNPGVDAATDAANEATDAANAATDAALAAAEAADAATTAAQEASDAVAALSASVTKLIEGLQAQIKSLAAVVAKIAKKVKA